MAKIHLFYAQHGIGYPLLTLGMPLIPIHPKLSFKVSKISLMKGSARGACAIIGKVATKAILKASKILWIYII